MKKLLVLVAGTTLLISNSFADTSSTTTNTPTIINQVEFEVGPSIKLFGSRPPAQGLGYLGYRHTDNWWYLQAGAGGWIGTRASGITAAQAGLNYKDFSFGTGPAYITNTSTSLGTHYQFMSTFRWTFNPYPVYVAWNHVSNGKKIWGGEGPNLGENFITVGYAYRF